MITPFGNTIVETETLEMMAPAGWTVTMFVQTQTFDFQWATMNPVVLIGILP